MGGAFFKTDGRSVLHLEEMVRVLEVNGSLRSVDPGLGTGEPAGL